MQKIFLGLEEASNWTGSDSIWNKYVHGILSVGLIVVP